MKSYLSLVPLSAKVHRRQSRMTRICIILAVFLVTSIFSMADMWREAETTQMRNNHGDWHIALQNIPETEAEQIRNNSDIACSSWYSAINGDGEQDYQIGGKPVALYGAEETYVTDIMNYPSEGSWPENETEAALSADAKELFHIEVGSRVVLNTPAGNLAYTVTGFYEDDEEFNDIIDGCCVYMNRTAFDKVCNLNGVEQEPQFYLRFEKERGLKKAIADLKEQYHLTSENVIENTGVLGMLGVSSSDSFKGIYPLAAVCFVIILIAGVLMISSCMNSNVAQRTRFFGMMRCIGASRQQIIRFVRLEALNWCKTAIPAGCVLGMVTGWIVSAVLRFRVKGEWVDMPLFYVSIGGILCGAVVGVITVFIAAHSPAKQAAKVSPVAAVSGSTETTQNIDHAASTKHLKVETSLGVRHAIGSKKNLCLMTGSFALVIALFLAFSACLDMVNKMVPSATSKFTPDMTIASEDGTNSIDRNLVEEISEISGVESAFGMMIATDDPVEINGNAGTIDLFSYGEDMMERFQDSIISGEVSKIYGDSGYVMAVYNEAGHLDVGDKIKIGDQEVEVACVASEGAGSVSGSTVVTCSEETYRRLTGEQDYATVSVITESDISESEVEQIRSLADGYQFADNREDNDTVSGSYWVFRIAAYGFLAIIALITVLNIMNSISMSVTARIKQYGAMRAVGMETRQVTKMITAEAVTYAVSGMAAGTILGLALHYLIYAKLIITHFGGSWDFPFTAIGMICLLVALSCVAAVYGPSKRMRNMAITDTINDL